MRGQVSAVGAAGAVDAVGAAGAAGAVSAGCAVGCVVGGGEVRRGAVRCGAARRGALTRLVELLPEDVRSGGHLHTAMVAACTPRHEHDRNVGPATAVEACLNGTVRGVHNRALHQPTLLHISLILHDGQLEWCLTPTRAVEMHTE